jgi:hypothetical protein
MSKSFMSEYKLSKPTDVRSNLTSLTLDVGNRGGNALNAKGNVDVTGNAILYGELTINSGVGQGYALNAKGNVDVSGTLTTTGIINAQGNIKLGNSDDDIGTMTYTDNNIITVKTGTNSIKTILFSEVESGGATSGEHFTLDICNALISFIPEVSGAFNNIWGGIKRLGLGESNVNNDSVKATLHVTDGDIFTNRGFKDIHGYGSNITQNVRYTLGQNSFGSSQNNFKIGTTDISNSDIFTVFNLNQTIDASLSPVQSGSNNVDLTDASLSFCGSVFDGRYVYFIPSEFYDHGGSTHYKQNNNLIRYDTFVDFSNTTSWQVIDLSNDISYNGTSLDLSGSYHGALFDGSAIYFSPFINTKYRVNPNKENVANKQLLRYNPYHNFRSLGSAKSYTSFDSGTVDVDGDNVTDTSGGYNGNVYDGRYIYYVPGSARQSIRKWGLDTHSTVLRYDTQASFTNNGSYNVYNLNNLHFGDYDKGYMGGCFDGQYIYFAPYRRVVNSETEADTSNQTHGYAVRYNTHSEFSSVASWNTFDLSANYASITGLLGSDGIDGGKNLTGYSGCVYDGRYVYYIPYEKSYIYNDFSANTTIARYDTQYNDASFSDVRAWSYYDLTHKFGSLDGGGSGLGLGDKMKGGFFGACYDGQNIWFIPSAAQFADANADKWSSLLVKYDTQQSFIDPSAYIGYDLSGLEGFDSDKLGGYRGCSFDGRYLYLTPWRKKSSDGSDYRANGCVMRVDTGAPSQRLGINHLANSKEFFINSAGKVGIGTNTPDSNYLLDVSGSIAAHSDICGHNFYAQDISARNIYLSNDISGLDASFHNLSVDRIYTDPAGKTLVIDSSFMITGGNVGIGVVPSYNCTLDISSVSGTGDSSIRLRREGGVNWKLINDSAGDFKITTDAGALPFVIDSLTFNVGIGTTNPESALHVVGDRADTPSTNGGAGIHMGKNSNNYAIEICAAAENASSFIDFAKPGHSKRGRILYYHSNVSPTNDYMGFDTNDTQRMLIDGNGNVGIGTTAPDQKLHVDGKIRIEDGEIGNISINSVDYTCFAGRLDHNNTNFALAQRVGTGDTLLNAPSGKKITFGINGSGKMILNSSGYVGIGTTSPYCPLHVKGYGGYISNATSQVNNSSGGKWTYMHGDFTTQTGHTTNMGTSSVQRNKTGIFSEWNIVTWAYSIAVFGNLTSSDSRIKNNIQDINDSTALNILRQLKPKTYGYKDVVSRGSDEVIGFIAQEVKELIPLAVEIDTQFLPNIYCLSALGAEGVVEFDTNKMIIGDNVTGRISLRDKNDGEQILEVGDYTVISTGIQVSKDISEYVGDNNEIFIYGQEVNDFHLLKKESVFTIATAALQEVDRQLQAEKAKTATLETKTATLETTVADLVARITALENA